MQTVEKLVTHFGYPESLRSLTFSWDYMTKGLIIDKGGACGGVESEVRMVWKPSLRDA